jgi:cytochrome c oxidase subunit II
MSVTARIIRRIAAAAAALTVAALVAVHGAGAAPPAVVAISAHRFDFSPAEVPLERGQPVVLRLTSLDVTHGFYSKQLGLDEIIEHGKTLDVPLTPGEAGRFTVICDHFCGAGHGNMKLVIVVK